MDTSEPTSDVIFSSILLGPVRLPFCATAHIFLGPFNSLSRRLSSMLMNVMQSHVMDAMCSSLLKHVLFWTSKCTGRATRVVTFQISEAIPRRMSPFYLTVCKATLQSSLTSRSPRSALPQPPRIFENRGQRLQWLKSQ